MSTIHPPARDVFCPACGSSTTPVDPDIDPDGLMLACDACGGDVEECRCALTPDQAVARSEI